MRFLIQVLYKSWNMFGFKFLLPTIIRQEFEPKDVPFYTHSYSYTGPLN